MNLFPSLLDNWEYSWFYAMFVLGTVFPPLLPSVFVVSVGISCKRLQRKRITCTDSRGILIAGKVKRAFFDKTGTLTKQGLDFLSAKTGAEFQSSMGSASSGVGVTDPTLKLGLATCHTLHASKGGALIGPAVDRMGFSAVSAQVLDEKSIIFEGTTVTYLKRFEFDHHSMTQSVVISQGGESTVFVKGSPEAIAKLCVPSSLPSNFHEMARQSARNGMYQLAMATSPLKSAKSVNEIKREDIEKDLNFAGVINFQNSMKEDTPQVIRELREGDIISAMITVSYNPCVVIMLSKSLSLAKLSAHLSCRFRGTTF
jgi:magnesium-transporting ATPase (P-type)